MPDLFDDDLLGEEDDLLEQQELGIDYMTSDPTVEETMGQGRAPVVVMNPGTNKLLRKAVRSVDWINSNSVLITFEDGDTLTCKG